MSWFASNSVRALGVLTALLLGGGCRPSGVEVYTIPKEELPPAARAQAPATTPATPALTWETPPGWTALPPGQFRVASFKVTGPNNEEADISVIPLPGGAGGDFSNVNRWREQAGLPPLTPIEFADAAEIVEINNELGALYDLPGAALRILGVIYQHAGTAWFMKMTGGPQVVGAEKPAFIEFLRSFQFAAAPPHDHDQHHAHDHDQHAPGATGGRPRWTTPAGWTEAPAGQFLVAKYNIAGGATLNISSSAGDGGGLVANVNRWRGQLGLPQVSADAVTRATTTSASGATLIDLTHENAAVLGAMVARPDQTWFYKLMGEPAAIAATREAFLTFVEGVRY